MKSTKATFQILALMVFIISILSPSVVVSADTQVEPCDPILTAGTHILRMGKYVRITLFFARQGHPVVSPFS